MSLFFDDLRPSVTRLLNRWATGDLAPTIALGGIGGAFVFALFEEPGRRPAIAAVLDLLPPPVVADLAEWLSTKRDTDGRWEWPPEGAINGGGPHFRPATMAEAAAYNTLAGWLAIPPGWRTSDAVGLARAISDDQAFERLPLLADALMDAGCDDEAILSHCRSGEPHVRGCWVVDLVLAKE